MGFFHEHVHDTRPGDQNTGASKITANSASLCGNLFEHGCEPTWVYCYWGTNAASWDSDSLGPVWSRGSEQQRVPRQDTTYYFRYLASNASDVVWAPDTNSFTTLPSLGAAARTNSLWYPADYAVLASSLAVTNGSSVAIDTGDGRIAGQAW